MVMGAPVDTVEGSNAIVTLRFSSDVGRARTEVYGRSMAMMGVCRHSDEKQNGCVFSGAPFETRRGGEAHVRRSDHTASEGRWVVAQVIWGRGVGIHELVVDGL